MSSLEKLQKLIKNARFYNKTVFLYTPKSKLCCEKRNCTGLQCGDSQVTCGIMEAMEMLGKFKNYFSFF